MTGNTLNLGQFANLAAAVTKALPRDITPHDALAWEKNGEAHAKALALALRTLPIPIPQKQEKFILEILPDGIFVQEIAAGRYDWMNNSRIR